MKLYCAKGYEQAGRITANILAAQITDMDKTTK